MKKNISKENKNKYLAQILAALHLNKDQFKKALAEEDPYESIIYQWSMKSFKKRKTPDEALKLIFKARNFHILKNNKKIT